MLYRHAVHGWIGATPDDQAEYDKARRRARSAKVGTYMRVTYVVPRNGKHHRKLWPLLELIVQNSEVYDTKEKALAAIKLAAGFFDPIVDPESGAVQKVPHSIAFDAMGQQEFERFYRAALHAVLAVILPQFDEPMALRLMDEIVKGWVSDAPG